MIGWSAGFTLRNVGGEGMLGGSCPWACVIMDCTSWAAASMFRLRSNCRLICVLPCVLVDDMESRPAIVENCRSSGVATEEAMVSGLAPGRFAITVMVG